MFIIDNAINIKYYYILILCYKSPLIIIYIIYIEYILLNLICILNSNQYTKPNIYINLYFLTSKTKTYNLTHISPYTHILLFINI